MKKYDFINWKSARGNMTVYPFTFQKVDKS